MLTQPMRFPFEEPPALGQMIEVASGIHWIRLPLPMRLDHVNIYALEDEGGWTIIDTGIFSKKGKGLWADLMAGPLGGKPIHRIILTHHHPDHVGAAGWLKSEYGISIWSTRTAWLMARMLTLDTQEAYPPESIEFFRRTGMPQQLFEKRISERPYNFSDMVAPIPLGYKRIRQGDTLKIGTRNWDVHIGHGHAPEHATFWSQDGEMVIAGDQVIPNISSNLGVYPTEPEADPVGDWFESCERFAKIATDQQLVLPGHKLPFTGLPTRLAQLIDNHHTALARLIDYLSAPRKAAECFRPLFGREIEEGAYGLALVETIGHLNHLFDLGQITKTLDQDGAYVWQKA